SARQGMHSLLGFTYQNDTPRATGLSLIRPMRAGYNQCKEDRFIQRAEDYPYFTVHILFSGCSLVELGRQQQLLKAGDAFFIFPGQKHTYYNTEEVGYLWIEIDYAAYLDLYHLLDGRFVVHQAESAQFQPALLAILDYLKHVQPVNYYTLSSLCYTFIMKISESVQRLQAPQLSPLVQAAQQYINLHFRQALPIDTIAEALHVSKSSLTKQFRAQTQDSIGQYILAKKLEYAIMQLKTTQKSCAEIAAEINFYDAAHLNKAFKTHLNILPSDFRR
ncbi:MAG: AraC family transcriptional regulator, partial [Faecalibacterium sp.]